MWRKTRIFMDMIKIEHTLFALPFAFMGALLGSVVKFQQLPSWGQIGWILLAMVGARSAAMGLNRVIDKVFDARNPRTAMRAIPAGLISSKEAIIFYYSLVRPVVHSGRTVKPDLYEAASDCRILPGVLFVYEALYVGLSLVSGHGDCAGAARGLGGGHR